MKVKCDHRSKFSNLSNWKEEAWKKKSGLQRDSNPWPPRYRCHALPTELWSHTLGARSIYWVHFFPCSEIMWNIYEIIHICTAVWDEKPHMKCDHRSKVFQFKQLERRSLKKIRNYFIWSCHGFESRWSPDFFQASSFQLLKLENLLRWSHFTFRLLIFRNELNKLTLLPVQICFIAQLVEHPTGIAEVMGSNAVEALIFFFSGFFFPIA